MYFRLCFVVMCILVDDGSYCAQFRLTENRRSCGRTPLSEWPKLLKPGTRLCVECQPLVMSGGGGVGMCTGHGVLNRETRWTAVGVPGCRGKWVMTTPHAHCRCPADNQFSFVLVWATVTRIGWNETVGILRDVGPIAGVGVLGSRVPDINWLYCATWLSNVVFRSSHILWHLFLLQFVILLTLYCQIVPPAVWCGPDSFWLINGETRSENEKNLWCRHENIYRIWKEFCAIVQIYIYPCGLH